MGLSPPRCASCQAHHRREKPQTQEGCPMVSPPSSTTRDLPPPLSPPECDLRGYEYMPLFGQRLAGSTFYSLALSNPRAGLAALKLWWEAWQQCPAGSLPSDDRTLCRMADFGTDLRGWGRAKTVALHGFIMCSDGRLYHPLLCSEALLAYGKRVKGRDRKARYRAGLDGDGTGTEPSRPAGQDGDGTRDGTETERPYRTGQVQDREKEERNPPGPPLGKGGRRRRDKSLN